METELTSKIKKLTHAYKPKMSNGVVGRTVRYADEVTTPHGIVDSIRFEDYVINRECFCMLEKYSSCCKADQNIINKFIEKRGIIPGKCKLDGCSYPNKNCTGCFFHKRGLANVGMMITAFEIKITVHDFKSNYGHNINDINNPIANENYYVVPKEIVKQIKDLVPKHVGILVYNGQGLRKYKEPEWMEVSSDMKITLLYNSLKKWCDGKQE